MGAASDGPLAGEPRRVPSLPGWAEYSNATGFYNGNQLRNPSEEAGKKVE